MYANLLPKIMKWKKGKDNFAPGKKTQPIEGLPIELIGKYSFGKLGKRWGEQFFVCWTVMWRELKPVDDNADVAADDDDDEAVDQFDKKSSFCVWSRDWVSDSKVLST